MTEPPFADQLIQRTWGTALGLQRRLNKCSPSRGCSNEAGRFPPQDVPLLFRDPHQRISLAFGTCEGSGLLGQVLSYPLALRARLLAELDRREGYLPEKGLNTCGYLRDTVTVEGLEGSIEAITYLSNPKGHFHVPALTRRETATILIHGTPDTKGHRACGLHYLTDVIRYMEQAGYEDAYLNDVHQEIQTVLTEMF